MKHSKGPENNGGHLGLKKKQLPTAPIFVHIGRSDRILHEIKQFNQGIPAVWIEEGDQNADSCPCQKEPTFPIVMTVLDQETCSSKSQKNIPDHKPAVDIGPEKHQGKY